MGDQTIRPYRGDKPYVFISYSHRDATRVMPTLGELVRRGYRLWYDEGIETGSEWAEVVAERLYSSALVLCFVSGHYSASQNCKREVNFAVSKGKKLCAVYLDEEEISLGLQMQLESVQAVKTSLYDTPDTFIPKLLANECFSDESLLMSVEEANEEDWFPTSHNLVSELTIAVGVCAYDGKVVMVKRAMREGTLLWQFPAAMIKPSEEIERKIVREVRQEAGITTRFSHIIGRRIHPDTQVMTYYCALDYVSGEVENGDDYENAEARLVDIDTYRELITSDVYGGIAEYLDSYRSKCCRPEVVMSIVTRGDEVLLVRRSKSEGALLWQFPGGTVEPGETAEMTALRELREETNVEGRVLSVIGERIHPYTKKRIAYVAIEYCSGELKCEDEEIGAVAWVPLSTYETYFTTPLFDKVRTYLDGHRGI